jgi:hypothetical protein
MGLFEKEDADGDADDDDGGADEVRKKVGKSVKEGAGRKKSWPGVAWLGEPAAEGGADDGPGTSAASRTRRTGHTPDTRQRA